MTDSKRIEHWLCVLRGAERQLDAARLRSDHDHAARRLMNAKLELARLGVDWREHLLIERAASDGAPRPHRRIVKAMVRGTPDRARGSR
jgi:hypothetical protein